MTYDKELEMELISAFRAAIRKVGMKVFKSTSLFGSNSSEKTQDHALPMTPAEMREQRISFAFGNASLDNPNITKDLVRELTNRS